MLEFLYEILHVYLSYLIYMSVTIKL